MQVFFSVADKVGSLKVGVLWQVDLIQGGRFQRSLEEVAVGRTVLQPKTDGNRTKGRTFVVQDGTEQIIGQEIFRIGTEARDVDGNAADGIVSIELDGTLVAAIVIENSNQYLPTTTSKMCCTELQVAIERWQEYE